MAAPPLTITPVTALPEDLDGLSSVAEAEGFGALARLRRDWARGENRFDRPGEVLLVARRGGDLVGICGLNIDPFVRTASEGTRPVGRVRRLFVLPTARRCGVARALVSAIREYAAASFGTLQLRTHALDADAFYRALGFTAVASDAAVTHRLTL